jgi:hypothetical protein
MVGRGLRDHWHADAVACSRLDSHGKPHRRGRFGLQVATVLGAPVATKGEGSSGGSVGTTSDSVHDSQQGEKSPSESRTRDNLR